MSDTNRTNRAQVMTANRLVDGVVVYLDQDGTWSRSLERARVATDDAGARFLMRSAEIAAELRQVVGPYLIDLDGPQRPLRLRERIRQRGPTVAYGEQAMQRKV